MTRLHSVLACVAGVLALLVVPMLQAEETPRQGKVKAGAYYFDGWSGHTDAMHLPELLKTQFGYRKPVWGWHANTVEIMEKQIDYAADFGLSFWAFDWYYPEGPEKETPLNNALKLYLQAKNRSRLEFCLLVANHGGYRIGPADWPVCCQKWIDLFREPGHLRANGKPLLIIFSHHELNTAFGGPQGVKQALDELRQKAVAAGLPGVTVAACTEPGSHLRQLAESGYDVLTGYAYTFGWMSGRGERPFQELIEGHASYYEQFAQSSPLPYIPLVTSGWDRRPWEMGSLPPEKLSVWYTGRTAERVEEIVRLAVQWIEKHPDKTVPERLLLIYAWNENGEGGYLTPTEAEGTSYLEAVRRALQ